MIREYSLGRDGDLQLSPHFRLREFASKDGSDKVLVDDALVDLLEQIRAAAGGAVTINSGYRSPAHNAAVGGVSSSQHLYGRAADIVVEGASPLLVGQIAEYYLDRRGGIGVYKSFTHVDTRAVRSRWDQRSGRQVVVGGWPGWEAEMTQEQFNAMFKTALSAEAAAVAEQPVSDWAKEAWEKAVAAGIFDGTRPHAPLTRQEAAVLLDRKGLLEVK